MAQGSIVVVEDEPDILEVVRYNLEREGYEAHPAADGEAGLQLVQKRRPDLVLLDLMLPGMDGLELCRRLKYDPLTRDIPIVMVTAKGEEGDVVTGLEIGADDYVVKPFSPRELLARVKAVLRRSAREREGRATSRVEYGELSIDPERHEVRLGGKLHQLTATEFRLLHFLASHPGKVFTRQRLLRESVGEDVYVLDRNVDVHVRSLRKKLGEDQARIGTVRGVGYRFEDEELV